MRTIDEIRRRMRGANLSARRELCEIEREAIAHRIATRLMSCAERDEAIDRRDVLLSEWVAIMDETHDFEADNRSRRFVSPFSN